MQITKRELWLLNFYRNSELHGSLLMGRLARSVREPELITNFTRHAATEAHHATLFSELLQRLRLHFEPTITVQEAYAEQGGIPKELVDLLVASEVLEKRVLKTYKEHLERNEFSAPIQELLRTIVHEMEEEEEGEHAGWIDRQLQLLPKDTVERAESKWKGVDGEAESALKRQLEQNYSEKSADSVAQKTKQVIARVAMVPLTEVQDEATISSLGISSFDQIECVLAIEEAFQLELSQETMECARTVSDLIHAVERARLAKQSVLELERV